MQNNPIVQIDVIDNEPRVSAMVIADNTKVKYESIRDLIRKYSGELSKFGELHVTDLKSATDSLGRQNKAKMVLLLNEQQSTLLITFLKNTKEVVEFKVNLVKAFFLMKEKLSGQVAHQDFNPILLEIVKSSQATADAVVRMGESMQSFTKHFLEMNNEMTRLKSHTRDTLNEMNHTMKNMSIVISAARGDAQQGMQVGEEVLKVVEKLEIYYRRDTLTSTQQQQINRRIDERARELASEHGIKSEVAKMSIYIKLKSYFDVPMYSAIKSESFAKALQVIDDHSLTYEECGE
jgi:phage regulator Rha-like protein